MIDERKLVEIARELIGCEEIDMETDRKSVDGWDSLAHVMLIAAVAEAFGVNVPVDDVSKVCCLKDFKKYE